MSNQLKALYLFVGVEEQIDWNAVYEAELPRVYNYFLYKTGNRENAQDLTATTFERVWKARHRYRASRAALVTWLFGFTKNVLKEYFRQNKRDSQLSKLIPSNETRLETNQVENKVLHLQERERLYELLFDLPDREQNLIALKYGSGLTNREIAKITGLTESNVGSILYRTVTALKHKCEE
jgi:RNA polymerase sigma-70 factor (ECF subfamily)